MTPRRCSRPSRLSVASVLSSGRARVAASSTNNTPKCWKERRPSRRRSAAPSAGNAPARLARATRRRAGSATNARSPSRRPSQTPDRAGSVAGGEAPCPLDGAGVEEQRLLAREQARADPRADGVADAVAHDGGDDQQPVDPPDVEAARRGDEPGRHQERIPGQEEAD